MKQEIIPAVQTYEVEACNALAEQVQSHLALAWHKAVQLGYKLQLLKASCAHGEWGKLFELSNANHDSHFSFGRRMAEKYMQLYDACEARARQLETEGNFLELMEYTCSTPGAEQVMDVEAKETELSAMLSSMSNGATSMRQALFAFMGDDAPDAPSSINGQSMVDGQSASPKGKPLPHMRRLPKIEKPKEEPNYRDLYAAEWPGVLAVVETYITDRAPRLYQHDREQYAAQLRELAAAMAAAKGAIVRAEPAPSRKLEVGSTK